MAYVEVAAPRRRGLGATAVTGAGTMLPDGTTTGSRELIIAALSVQVAEWQQRIANAIANDFSATDIIFRPIGSVIPTLQMRMRLQEASDKLSSQFLPMVAGALRDYSRSTDEVIAVAQEYLRGQAAAFGAALSSEEATRFAAIMRAARDEAVRNVRDALDAGKEAVDEMLPWWAYVAIGLVGCATVAYTIRSIK